MLSVQTVNNVTVVALSTSQTPHVEVCLLSHLSAACASEVHGRDERERLPPVVEKGGEGRRETKILHTQHPKTQKEK